MKKNIEQLGKHQTNEKLTCGSFTKQASAVATNSEFFSLAKRAPFIGNFTILELLIDHQRYGDRGLSKEKQMILIEEKINEIIALCKDLSDVRDIMDFIYEKNKSKFIEYLSNSGKWNLNELSTLCERKPIESNAVHQSIFNLQSTSAPKVTEQKSDVDFKP